MSTIIATLNGATSNSYVTLAWADAYHVARLAPAGMAWETWDQEDRQKALVSATARLDEEQPFWGTPYDTWTPQALYFPRGTDRNPTTAALEIPDRIEMATAELALAMLVEVRAPDPISVTEPQRKGVAMAAGGGMSFAFSKGANDLPLKVQRLIEPFVKRGGPIEPTGTPRREWHEGWVAV